MKKTLLLFFCLIAIIVSVALVLVQWHFYKIEKNTLYKDIVYVEVKYTPRKHITTLLGRGMLGEVDEKWMTILTSKDSNNRRKLFIGGKEVYEQIQPFEGKVVSIFYRAYPFRVISISLPPEN